MPLLMPLLLRQIRDTRFLVVRGHLVIPTASLLLLSAVLAEPLLKSEQLNSMRQLIATILPNYCEET